MPFFRSEPSARAKRDSCNWPSRQPCRLRRCVRAFGISRPTGLQMGATQLVHRRCRIAGAEWRPRTSPERTFGIDRNRGGRSATGASRSGVGEKLQRGCWPPGWRGVPSGRTCTTILERHGLLEAVSPVPRPGAALKAEAPNDLWQLDFKGPLPQRQGQLHALSVLNRPQPLSSGADRLCRKPMPPSVRP